jgi:outer membrane biogenesis lipoprotein LolB
MRRVRAVTLGVLLAMLTGCMSAAEPEAARKAWEEHDRELARNCRGAVMEGSCISIGGGR